MTDPRSIRLLALPVALMGLTVGVLLILFDPVLIARQRPTSSIARSGPAIATTPVPLEVTFSPEDWATIRAMSPVPPPPEDTTNRRGESPRAAWLGQQLFFDERLSGTGTLSCASCHDPAKWFADGRTVAEGAGRGTRNTPSLLNVAHQRWFTWDGRHDSLWSQGLEPIEREHEMAGNRVAAVRVVAEDPDLRVAYENVFGPLPPLEGSRLVGPRIPAAAKPVPDNPDHPLHVAWMSMTEGDRERINRAYSNIGKAIAAYESMLTDGPSAFDRFIAGLTEDGTASTDPLSSSELRGLGLFVGKAGCVRCHHGPLLTDDEFHQIGVPPRSGGMPDDPGRFAAIELLRTNPFRASGPYSDAPESDRGLITDALVNSPENWGRIKTPSLRGVAKTAPYMHAGQFDSIEQVLRFYSTLEGAVALDHHAESVLEPLNLTPQELTDLAAFLQALHGPGPAEDLMGKPRRPFGASTPP